KTKMVQTVAGTGEQARDYFRRGPARTIALSSPWDLQLVEQVLYITMAGTHQIWKLDLNKQEVSTFAGSGSEARQDGPLLEAGFAQPSGIASAGSKLYIADSESNIIRAIALDDGEVKTIAGGDLFDFGDVDGSGDRVRLQHPLGVVALDDKIYIADTYNHKIKQLDPKTRTVKSFLGTGKPGQADGGLPSFYEPGGLSVANSKLYVADTNNHAIRVVELKTKATSTLNIKGLEPPATSAGAGADQAATEAGPNAEEIRVASQSLRAGSDAAIVAQVELPQGYHLNPAAPQRYRVSVENGARQVGLMSATELGAIGHDQNISRSQKNLQLPLRIPVKTHEPGAAEVRVQLTLFYCREDNTGTCLIKTLVWRVPVQVVKDPSALRELRIQANLTAE
ncbi:MAG TPA: hypothetical protein VGW76_16895, partial [Pyrinomonadaceae bacterium]|nr:hypothetical protein [Pyrinomonadaceae bacterium]